MLTVIEKTEAAPLRITLEQSLVNFIDLNLETLQRLAFWFIGGFMAGTVFSLTRWLF